MITSTQAMMEANPKYFAPGNKKFFGDLSYRLHRHGKHCFLFTHTNKWSDMFGEPSKDVWTAKELDNDGVIINYTICEASSSAILAKRIAGIFDKRDNLNSSFPNIEGE